MGIVIWSLIAIVLLHYAYVWHGLRARRLDWANPALHPAGLITRALRLLVRNWALVLLAVVVWAIPVISSVVLPPRYITEARAAYASRTGEHLDQAAFHPYWALYCIVNPLGVHSGSTWSALGHSLVLADQAPFAAPAPPAANVGSCVVVLFLVVALAVALRSNSRLGTGPRAAAGLALIAVIIGFLALAASVFVDRTNSLIGTWQGASGYGTPVNRIWIALQLVSSLLSTLMLCTFGIACAVDLAACHNWRAVRSLNRALAAYWPYLCLALALCVPWSLVLGIAFALQWLTVVLWPLFPYHTPGDPVYFTSIVVPQVSMWTTALLALLFTFVPMQLVDDSPGLWRAVATNFRIIRANTVPLCWFILRYAALMGLAMTILRAVPNAFSGWPATVLTIYREPLALVAYVTVALLYRELTKPSEEESAKEPALEEQRIDGAEDRMISPCG